MNWYLQVLRKYAVFSGRARRREYWMFFLFNFLFSIFATVLDVILFSGAFLDAGMGFFGAVYSIAILLPGLAVTVRRLHDIGKSGWMVLIALIPLIGSIWLIVLLAREGDEGENEYGPDPKPGELDYAV